MSPGLGSFMIYSKDSDSDSCSQERLRVSALGRITQCNVPSNHTVGAERQRERERRPHRGELCWGWREETPHGATLGTPHGKDTKQWWERESGQLVNKNSLSSSLHQPCPEEGRDFPPTGHSHCPSRGLHVSGWR